MNSHLDQQQHINNDGACCEQLLTPTTIPTIIANDRKQETDSFEDACENLTQRSCRDVTNEERGASFDLKAQLEETRQVFGFFLNNQFNRALEICIPR